MKRIIIIGGGLSGLTLSYLLKKEGISSTILEATNRVGGRIHTQTGKDGTPLELGATWFSDEHSKLLALLQELGLKKYPQFSRGISLFQTKSFEPAQQFFVPEGSAPSYRIVGGTGMLITALAAQATVRLNTKVSAVNDQGIITIDNGETIEADLIISCLPPQVAGAFIRFTPALTATVIDVLAQVQTWMAGSIKFALEYDTPFWRNKGFSGMMYSHAGIISEMYDHTNFEGDKYGLTGFLNPGTAPLGEEERKKYVLRQLQALLGDEVLQLVAYYDKVWTGEYIQGEHSPYLRPHQNNGHEIFGNAYLNGRFYFCGTETAQSYPGYMEGAVIAAEQMKRRCLL